MQIALSGISFQLLPEKALYKPDESLLIIADVHLGKAAHFRKNGLPITSGVQQKDFDRLKTLFANTSPRKVYFLGDLFHSVINNDWLSFKELLCHWSSISFTLIKGNHDLIEHKHYDACNVTVIDSYIEDDHFIYSHEPIKNGISQKINIAGHIHPGIALTGAGRQYLKLPCFHHSGNQFLLPAFGSLTGLYIMQHKKTDNIYVVTSEYVRAI